MIIVYVKLFATLRRYWPGLNIGETLPMELPAGATVGQLIERLGLPEEVKTIFVNGIVRDRAHTLAEGDEVALFPPVAGG